MELNNFEAKLVSEYMYLKVANVKLECENDALKKRLADLQNDKKKK